VGRVASDDLVVLGSHCDEAYAIISNDYLTGKKETPDGFNRAQLQADLQDLK
jgi:hypothetical protein